MSILAERSCRFPVLSAEGEQFLAALAEHPSAPHFRDASGHRLRDWEIGQVRDFHGEEIARPACGFALPPWLPAFERRLRLQVPFFRHFPEGPFRELPTTSRADLAADIAAFVPDDLPLDRLLHFQTTGTTGHRISIPSHPTVAAAHLAFLRKALALHGVELRAGRGETGVVLAGFQERCFTYVSVNPLFDEAGVVKLNLHPDDWSDPGDRARYLDWLRPEIVSGDPLSLPEVAAIGMAHRPRAALSTSMALTPALRRSLSTSLGCPVLDVYSLNESGPVAVKPPGSESFQLLQSRLLVELLGEDGCPVADGERGEIALTGGFNPWLPLFRYRTGDWARRDPGNPLAFADLEGRGPVRFLDGDGRWRNNIEVSQCLSRFAIPQFALHQSASGAIRLRLHPASVDREEIQAALDHLLRRTIEIDALEPRDKVLAFSSDLPGSGFHARGSHEDDPQATAKQGKKTPAQEIDL